MTWDPSDNGSRPEPARFERLISNHEFMENVDDSQNSSQHESRDSILDPSLDLFSKSASQSVPNQHSSLHDQSQEERDKYVPTTFTNESNRPSQQDAVKHRITKNQLNILQREFEINSEPTTQRKAELAEFMGVGLQNISVSLNRSGFMRVMLI